MIYKNFSKIVKKLLIDKEMTLKQIADTLGESQQNINGKINRETIRLMDAERILDAIGYKLVIKEKDK
ncbi:hypothetical protein [Caminicella sporogenes]|uniref:hypothetical protein n=1 Tax=Caminicella sporogenes TaxID=166485 RepID=UPI0025415BA1|nr:hypothetical protein [Caminicella sporogenes]WIF94292.1 hypothetical protein QNI18_08345 [Caminicella sporogenes]